MEYIYSVMLLNKAGKEITQSNIEAVLKAAGIQADVAKVKSLIAALDGVDIEQVIKESSVVSAAAPASSSSAATPAEEKKEEKKEEEKTSTADAAAGLGSLF
jgi:large subunit ribosomal protein L12